MTQQNIACLGDPASHPGSLVSTNQDGKALLAGIAICVDQANFACQIPFHGTTPVTAITTKSKINGKLIITTGAQAQCGASMEPPNRKAYCE